MPGAFRQTDHSAVPSRLRPCGRIKKPLSRVNQRAATVGDNGADEAAPPGPNGFAGTTIATLAAVSVQWRRVPDARWRNGRADLHEAAPTACLLSGKAVPQGMDERRQRGVRCGMHGLLRDSHANFQPVDIEKATQRSAGRNVVNPERSAGFSTWRHSKARSGHAAVGNPQGFPWPQVPLRDLTNLPLALFLKRVDGQAKQGAENGRRYRRRAVNLGRPSQAYRGSFDEVVEVVFEWYAVHLHGPSGALPCGFLGFSSPFK